MITEMLEDAFGSDGDVWYSVDIKTQNMRFVRMRIVSHADGKDLHLSRVFDPPCMAHLDEARVVVGNAVEIVIRCKADPSLIGE